MSPKILNRRKTFAIKVFSTFLKLQGDFTSMQIAVAKSNLIFCNQQISLKKYSLISTASEV
jgi:hypothetical protein